MGFDGKATLKQIEFINKLLIEKELLNNKTAILKADYSCDHLSQLTRGQASHFIQYLLSL